MPEEGLTDSEKKNADYSININRPIIDNSKAHSNRNSHSNSKKHKRGTQRRSRTRKMDQNSAFRGAETPVETQYAPL